MSWTCNRCLGSRLVVDVAKGELDIIGCVECAWSEIVRSGEDGPYRCVAHTHNGARCGRSADMSGMCWQHAEKENAWDLVYARFRNAGDDDIPDAYREIFARACIDAGLIANFLRDRDRDRAREQELADLAPAARVYRKRPVDTKPTVVYFMRREGLIKIGVTTDIAKRAKAISKGSSMPDGMTIGPVEVLATTPGDGAFESKLHRQFAASCVQGEWFRPTPKLLRLIARYQRRAAEAEAA